MVVVTTNGLRGDGTPVAALPNISWAAATGSANVIAVTYDPPVTGLVDGLILGFRASAANTLAQPTFNPNGLGASLIVKAGNKSLVASDIPGAGAECLVRYRASTGRWELLNPYYSSQPTQTWGNATDVNDIAVTYVPPILSVTDGTMLSFRSVGANTGNMTFSPNGLPAAPIVCIDFNTGSFRAVLPGEIPGAGYEATVRYNGSAWVLLNPSPDPSNDAQEFFRIQDGTSATGQNVSTVQPWFPAAGAVQLAVGTYEIAGALDLTRSAGTTSHTTALRFGGSATYTLRGRVWCRSGDADALNSDNSWSIDESGAIVKAASTSATEAFSAYMVGTLRVTVAGTLIPQFQYSAAPGGAPQVRAHSYFKGRRLAASAAMNAWGPWT